MAGSVAQPRFSLEVDLTLHPSRASQSLVDESSHLKVIAIESPADMQRAHAIRRRVFIEEQQVPEDIEMDADDAHAFHALAILDGVAVGCGRMVEHGAGEVKIGRMAVLLEKRNTWHRRADPALPDRSGARARIPQSDPARTTHCRRLLSEGRIHSGGRRLRRGRHRAPPDGTRALANHLTSWRQTPRSRAQPLPASRGSHDDARWESSPAAHSRSTRAPALRPPPS